MNIYEFKVRKSHKDYVSLSEYKDKVLLIFNSAPFCGLSHQYKGIQKLYQKYQKNGLEILDFPCNQFAYEAPMSDEKIQSYCEINFQTTFTTFFKVKVNGKKADPLFKFLREKQPKDMDKNGKNKKGFLRLFLGNKIKWNFTKFLVNKEGKVLYRFSPSVSPREIEIYIKKILDIK